MDLNAAAAVRRAAIYQVRKHCRSAQRRADSLEGNERERALRGVCLPASGRIDRGLAAGGRSPRLTARR